MTRKAHDPAYPAAREASAAIEAHFIGLAARSPDPAPPRPDRTEIERFLDVAFWASLRREEGHSPRISITHLPSDLAASPLLFERSLPFTPATLTRLAPAVERPGIHLGVWPVDGEPRIWGTTGAVPPFGFVVEVVEPGILVVKYRRGSGPKKFGNIAVLVGHEVRIIDHDAGSGREYTPAMEALVDLDPDTRWTESASVMVELGISMRDHGRGGALLVVPRGSEGWRESMVKPMQYAVAVPSVRLAQLMAEQPTGDDDPRWRAEVQREVAAVAGLTAVDGATVMGDDFDVRAFGAKIGRREGFGPVTEVLVSEPVVGRSRALVHPTVLGGTRHLSAAQFAHDQRDSRALVASQDGRFTVFAWSEREGRVLAHRIESLLL